MEKLKSVKNIVTICMILTAYSAINAQQWNTNGNALTGTLPSSPNEFLGSTNSSDLLFYSNNTEKMRLTSTGNLGIGITNPTYQMEILGSTNAKHGIRINNSGSGSSAFATVLYGNDLNQTMAASIFLNSSTNTAYAGAGSFNIGTILTNKPVGILVNNNLVSTFNSNGFGVGMIPTNTIDAYNSGLSSAICVTSDNGGGGYYAQFLAKNGTAINYMGINGTGTSGGGAFGTPNLGYLTNNNAAGLAIGATNGSGQVFFYTGGSASANERMRITSNGYVGIGTTSPTSLFSVGSSSQFQVNSSGDLVKINGINYTWPTANAAANGYVLTSTTGGTLTWAASGGTGPTGPTGPTGATGATGAAGSSGWSLSGNTLSSTEWFGTVNNYDIVMKINSTEHTRLTNGGDLVLKDPGGKFILGSENFLWNNNQELDLFVGYKSGNSSMTGHSNTLVGYFVGNDITTGSANTAMGTNSFGTNTTGHHNTVMGTGTLNANTTGSDNTAIGSAILSSNASGNKNTAIGAYALAINTGSNNTAVGYSAGYTPNANISGENNTYIGYQAGADDDVYDNATAIGNGAIATASDYVAIGNTDVTAIEGQVSFGTYSDGRFKINVNENVKGLTFINKLRPVTYNMDTKKLDDFLIQNMPDSIKTERQEKMNFLRSTSIFHSGFIAQEVDQAAKEVGFVSSIVRSPTSIKQPYAISYAEMVVPLVKAVQELSHTIDSLLEISTKLQGQIDNCCTKVQGMKINGTSVNGVGLNSTRVDTDNVLGLGNTLASSSAVLFQNNPNPFDQQTTIQYFIPTHSKSASIMIFDLQGKLVKTITLTNYGSASVGINGNELNPGMFVYSLVVDGKIIDTKNMILTQ